jgi:beta-galactosidase
VRLLLEPDQLTRGNNTIQVSFLSEGLDFDTEAAARVAAGALHLADAEADLTAKAEWAFAKWEGPAPSAYVPATRAAMGGTKGPTWWRTSFRAKDRVHPLLLELPGMTKGQVYLNGKHIGRYWVSGRGGWEQAQTRWYLPECWLRDDEDNELVLLVEERGVVRA